jgi:probable HAF family extracellular repeat protein
MGMKVFAGHRIHVFLLFLATASALSVAQTYTVTDLGTISGGNFSWAHAVNASGEVTGAAGNINSNISDIFLYSSGAITSLGTLGGNTGIGNGINSTGQIAGYATNSSGTYRAFVATDGKLTDLGDLGGGSATAYAINDVAQVVGSAVTSDGSNHPFLYSNGQMVDLGTLGSSGDSWWNSAQGINNAGVIVGTSYNAQGNFFGFVWSNGKMTKMGTLGGPWSQANAINNKNQITGLAYTSSATGRLGHAFIATGSGKLTDLGTIAGSASTTWGFGINDSGVVVGKSTFGNTYHAFVYSGGKMKDLNKLIPTGSGWVLIEADSINATGQIVGLGTHSGQEHGYLLTPQ